MTLTGKKILIFQQRGWGMRTGRFLAEKLRDEGCRLGAVIFKKSVYRFVTNQNKVKYEFISSHDELIEDPRSYLGGDNYTLEEICEDLQIDSVWPYVQSLREHVKSYTDKFYYGYKQDFSDDEITRLVKATYKNVKKIFAEFQPDAIITPNFVSLLHIFCGLYAKKVDVPMMRLTDSRVSGICLMVYDHSEAGGRFFQRFQELTHGAASQNFARAREYIERSSQKLVLPLHAGGPARQKTWAKKIREFASPFYKSLKFYFEPHPNRLRNIPVMTDYIPPKYLLRDFFAKRKYERFARNFPYDDFRKINKYIYFPLQFQPEETIDVLAPRFNNQLEVIRQIAMAAPGDYTVVIKEHPAMVGLRSHSYMEKLGRTPNVKFVDYRIPGEEVIRGADLIVSLSGTTLSEAAFLRKPAIQLGDLAITKLLPNVFVHTDFTTLSKKIKELLQMDFNNPQYDKKLINFVAAAYDTGLDADYVGIWRGLTREKMEDLWQFYRREIVSHLT